MIRWISLPPDLRLGIGRRPQARSAEDGASWGCRADGVAIQIASLVMTHKGERPGLGWHAHGVTSKWVSVAHEGRLVVILLYKQRWLHVATGTTRHDRPAWDVPWSRFGIEVVFLVLSAWVLAPKGLHHTEWPWSRSDPSPSPRTAQRWHARIRSQASAWRHAIRVALIDLLSPRPLEEIVPTAGIPPPGRRWRTPKSGTVQAVRQLHDGLWLLKRGATFLCIPARTLLVEAKARWPGTCPQIPPS